MGGGAGRGRGVSVCHSRCFIYIYFFKSSDGERMRALRAVITLTAVWDDTISRPLRATALLSLVVVVVYNTAAAATERALSHSSVRLCLYLCRSACLSVSSQSIQKQQNAYLS